MVSAGISHGALVAALVCTGLVVSPSSAAVTERRGASPKFQDNISKLAVSDSGPNINQAFDAVSTGCTGFKINGKPCASGNSINAAITEDPAGGGKALQVEYQAGEYASQSGAQFYTKYSDLGSEGTLEYSVYFPDNFDWVKGGKLPGMHGGNMECTGSKQKPNGHNCFSTRLMWGPGGSVEGYLYVPLSKQDKSFCSHCANEGGNAGSCGALGGDDYCHYDRGAGHFKKGSWNTVRQYVKLNSPGSNNGVFELWLNGKRIMSDDAVYYRDDSSMSLSGMLFSTFYGGDSKSYAPHKNERAYFKDITVYG